MLLAPSGKQIAVLSGLQLSVDGFAVNFTKEYDGNIYEIKALD